MAILIKPCFIYDVLCYAEQRFLEFESYYLDEQRNLLYKTNDELKKYNIDDFNRNGPSMSSMCYVVSCFTENKGIDKLGIKELMEIIKSQDELLKIVSERLKDNSFLLNDAIYTINWLKERGADGYIKFLNALESINFKQLWHDMALPRVEEECVKLENKIRMHNLESIFKDITQLRNEDKIDDVNIFVSLFSHPISFSLYNKSFLSSCLSDMVDDRMFLQIIIHELMHGFSNSKTFNLYHELVSKDAFLNRTDKTLRDKYFAAEEEQFVVAAEYYLAVLNGLATYDGIVETAKQRYGGCMPLSLIIFDLLMKEKKVPINYNLWLAEKLSYGCIKYGNTEKQIEDIAPGFIESYEQSLSS
jgi:hypothetical protein